MNIPASLAIPGRLLLLIALMAAGPATAQTEPPLPDRLKKLHENYHAAISRATAPITETYLKELERTKAEFTKAGDLNAALAADSLIKAAQETLTPPGASKSLAGMDERQFKKWLSGVVISEVDSPFGNQYSYVNEVVTTMKVGSTGPRSHPIATVEVGKLVVPFTSTTATVVIDPSLTKAEVSFTTGGKYQATITKRKD